ncbi:unnamed protein product, partial [Mesorhabditis belari]|uniref:Complex I assembly factor TIMMDC1, mitochondrial n=1 Tax=Mesorhabditis belari TaxID=2138241 RepID=A0AAF3FMV6_9BILA
MPDEEPGTSKEPATESLLTTFSSKFKDKLWQARQSQRIKDEGEPLTIKSSISYPPGPVYSPPWPTEQTWTAGWKRLKSIYEAEVSMERDVIRKVCTTSFIAAFLLGGASGYQEAGRVYEQTHVGKAYLSQRDALVRRMDYGILKFSINGTKTGVKAMLLAGSIIGITLHVAAYRAHFSPFYFPAFSVAVGGIFSFPLGVIGVAKAIGLGISSGFTLAAGYHLFALSIDKTADESYWYFKNEYEKELQSKVDFDAKVRRVMEENPDMWWKAKAIKYVKQLEEQERQKHDF